MGTLDDQVAVIIGGTSGIGAETALRFATEGARVVIAGRRAGAGEQLAAQLGPEALFVATDVTVEADVQELVSVTVQRFGRLDCLVNSAGQGGSAWSVTTIEIDRMQQAFALHVGGVAAAIRHAAPIMAGQGSGSIINVASVGGLRAGWSQVDYSCAKAAAIHLTRCAAVELGEYGVRVNSISPGPILTGIFAKGFGIDPAEADRTALQLESVFGSWLAPWRPLRRVGVPADVAGVAAWLASDASALVTGQDIAVDGGITTGPPASVLASAVAPVARALEEAGREYQSAQRQAALSDD
jgi:NAD(P)-dependent dehydrogenase (short-subunit alcohol dehydrogenase family)